MVFTMVVVWVYSQPLRQDSAELRATPRLPQSLQEEPPQGFEPWAYALRVRCSTPELRWLAQLSICALEF